MCTHSVHYTNPTPSCGEKTLHFERTRRLQIFTPLPSNTSRFFYFFTTALHQLHGQVINSCCSKQASLFFFTTRQPNHVDTNSRRKSNTVTYFSWHEMVSAKPKIVYVRTRHERQAARAFTEKLLETEKS